jgi:predicted nucleic acid-binding protein
MSVRLYLDAAVLVSLYVPERTTAAAESLVSGESEVAVSALTLLETRVALERKRKAGKLSSSAVAAVRARIEAEVSSRHLQLHAIEDADYHGADGISQRVQSPIRSLDAIHAAVAQRLGLELVTLDQRLHEAAQAAGISTRWVNPSTI